MRAIRQPRLGLGLHEHVYAFEVGPADPGAVLAAAQHFFEERDARPVFGAAGRADLVELQRGVSGMGVSRNDRHYRHGIAVYLAPIGRRGLAIRVRYWLRGIAVYAKLRAFEIETRELAERLNAVAPRAEPLPSGVGDQAWTQRWSKAEYRVLASMPSVLPRAVGILLLALCLPLVVIGGAAAAYLMAGTLQGDGSKAKLHGLTTALYGFLAWPLVDQGLRSLRRKPRTPGFWAWLALAMAVMASLGTVALGLWLAARA